MRVPGHEEGLLSFAKSSGFASGTKGTESLHPVTEALMWATAKV